MFNARLSAQQARLFDALAKRDLVAVQKGHSTGGTWAVWAYLLGELARHQHVKILTTGPTWDFVTLVSFNQCRELIHAARGRYNFPEPTEAFLDMSRDGMSRWIAGLSTTDVNRFSGHKAPRLIVFLDESAGVRPEVWSAIDGLRASGDVQVIAISQPHSPLGPFHDACVSANWHVEVMDCFGSPNLIGVTEADLRTWQRDDSRLDVVAHPHLVRRRWVWEMMAELSPAEWQAKVRGQFPDEDVHALFRLSKLYEARDRAAQPWLGLVHAGLDVAGGGRNETCLVVRGGPNILGTWATRDADSRGWALDLLRPFKDRLAKVRVDGIGIGHNYALHLRDHGLPVEAVNVGQPAEDSERFANLRAEATFGLRDRIEAGDLNGLTDRLTITQLAGLTAEPQPNGRQKITSKAKMRADGIDSPDRADAVVLAYLGDSPARARRLQNVNRAIDNLAGPANDRRMPVVQDRLTRLRSM